MGPERVGGRRHDLSATPQLKKFLSDPRTEPIDEGCMGEMGSNRLLVKCEYGARGLAHNSIGDSRRQVASGSFGST